MALIEGRKEKGLGGWRDRDEVGFEKRESGVVPWRKGVERVRELSEDVRDIVSDIVFLCEIGSWR